MLYVMPTLYTQPAFWFVWSHDRPRPLPRFVGKATHALQELTPAKRVLARLPPTTAARSRASAARSRSRASQPHRLRPHHRRAVGRRRD